MLFLSSWLKRTGHDYKDMKFAYFGKGQFGMKKVEKTISFVLTMGLSISMVLPAFAENVQLSNSTNDARQEYVESVLPRYLALKDNIDYGNIQISEPITVENREDGTSRTYIVTNDDVYIGLLSVAYIDNEFVSSYMFDEDSSITNIIQTGTPFALVAYDECLLMQTQENNIVVANDNIQLDEIELVHNVAFSEKSFESIDLLASSFSFGALGYNIEIDVEHVANETVNGVGICWAACIAAISNYRNGTSYDALDIYDALDLVYSETPVGDSNWIRRGYSYCGMSHTNGETLEVDELYDALNSDRPVIFRVYRTDSTGNLKGHAVVLKAITQTRYDSIYTFMDPNYTNEYYAFFDDTVCDPADLVYINADHTYDQWLYYAY